MTGQEQAKSETAGERGERRVWTPELVDESQPNLRVLATTPDAAAAELAAEFLAIAERAFGERSAAERIVGAILRSESQLVAAASRAASPAQREAAKSMLASMVRRAVLDAMPPVVPGSPTEQPDGKAATNRGAARKLRAAAPGTATEPTRRRGQRHHQLIAPALLAVLLLGGVAAWHFLLRPAPDAALPVDSTVADVGPPASASAGDAVPPAAVLDGKGALPTDASRGDAAPPAPAAPEVLQLEAREPTAGPLRPAEPGEPLAAAPDAAPAPRRIDMAPTARAAAGIEPGAGEPAGDLELPAGVTDLRVFLLYPEGQTAAAEAGDLYATLSESGAVPLVVLRDVSFAIASPRIRYFHDEDAAAAVALADFLDVPSDDSGAWEVQNFTHVSPPPAQGTIEIYVPSS